MGTSKKSLCTTLGSIIVVSVVIVIALHAYVRYDTTKTVVIRDLHLRTEHVLKSLESTVSTYIQAYIPSEYEKIIGNEMNHEGLLAIIVEDYATGAILGEKAYVSGKIRNKEWKSIDYDPFSAEQKSQLAHSSVVQKADIVGRAGNVIGKISVFGSDRFVKEKLDGIVIHALINAVTISLLLILLLFFSVRRYVVKPILQMVSIIRDSDEDGIPKQTIDINHSSKEIADLTETMNRMVHAVRQSRLALREQRDYLQSVVDGINEPLMVIDKEYNVRLMNAVLRERMEAYTLADPEAPKCYEVAHNRTIPCEKDKFQCPLQAGFESKHGRVDVHENVIDGQTRYMEVLSTPMLDGSGECLGIIETAHDITNYLEVQNALREQKDILHHHATHDALTGLANRVLFHDRLEQSLIKAKRAGTKVAVLFIDLDHFKEINDSLGHKTGDKVLVTATERIRKNIRTEDTLARLGGDEFTIIIEGLRDENDASVLAEKIIHAMKAPVVIDGHEFYISSSIGISIFPDNADNASDMLKNADAAMYRAKSEGRKNYQYYSYEMTLHAFERITMEANLRDAIKNREFEVYYQPQVNGRTNRLIGMEALVRWRSPVHGLVSPGRFLPVAEVSGLIVELDRFVMHEAIRQVAAWYREGLSPGSLSMNLTVKQMQQSDFIHMLRQYLDEHRCNPSYLELEVTEGQLMTRPEECIIALKELGDMGIKIALDDFGTGYSSLAYLKKLPLTKLKIDRSFVMGLPTDEEDVAISKAVIAMAKSLNLEIIAEGVETEAQASFLLENGCEHFQGYLYAKPMDAQSMQRYLENNPEP